MTNDQVRMMYWQRIMVATRCVAMNHTRQQLKWRGTLKPLLFGPDREWGWLIKLNQLGILCEKSLMKPKRLFKI